MSAKIEDQTWKFHKYKWDCGVSVAMFIFAKNIPVCASKKKGHQQHCKTSKMLTKVPHQSGSHRYY